jgi:hypothetical protein
VLSRWFDKHEKIASSVSLPGFSGPKVPRHSGGWAAVRALLESSSDLRVLDIGYTSPTNVQYLTSLGHNVFLADAVHEAYTGDWQGAIGEDGVPVWNVTDYLVHTLNFADRMFDVVLLWTTLDYLPEPLVIPVVERLYEATNQGGKVLAFFHSRTLGEETVHCRFHVTHGDEVDIQLAQQFPIQRAFTNRSIERLFAPWSGYRQFLAKDGVSEVIITR